MALPTPTLLVSTVIGIASSSGRPTGSSQMSALASISAMPAARATMTRLIGASCCSACFHGTAAASRGGDFQSSFRPVMATTTNSEWATMRIGACSRAISVSSSALRSRLAVPP